MKELVFLLEEPSMREVLQAILPGILPPEISLRLVAHEGKQDLERSIPRKLRAWQNPEARFVIIRDQDAANCEVLKQHLLQLCETAGRTNCLVRIVCRELESWFLGDLNAVSQAFDLPKLSKLKDKEKFRNPDHLGNAASELQKLVGNYSKIGGARAIAPHLDLAGNQSHSFQVFLEGLQRLVAEMVAAHS